MSVPTSQPPEKLSVALFELLDTVTLFALPEKLSMSRFYNSWGQNFSVSFAFFYVNNSNWKFLTPYCYDAIKYLSFDSHMF